MPKRSMLTSGLRIDAGGGSGGICALTALLVESWRDGRMEGRAKSLANKAASNVPGVYIDGPDGPGLQCGRLSIKALHCRQFSAN